jgi:membrane protein YdbS with pleckstrin-like domain
LPAFLRSYKIRLSKDGVIIRRGVIIKNTHILPFSRLIYTQTLVTPLAKLLKLKAITLKAARSTIVVPEMSAEDVDSLLALLANGDEE